MRRFVRLALCLCLTLSPVMASAGDGRRMLGDAEARAFHAVGRLNIAGSRFCTATLIAPDRVLTAAHCLYHPRTRRAVPLRMLKFVAGLRRGGYAAVRRVARAATPTDYVYDGGARLETVRADLALLQLDRPIRENAVSPLAVGAPARRGEAQALVSYARDRAHAPSIERACRVRSQIGPVDALDCETTFGASGAPVVIGDGAARRVAAIVSASARGPRDEPLSLTVEALRRLPELERRLAAGEDGMRHRRPGRGAGRAGAASLALGE